MPTAPSQNPAVPTIVFSGGGTAGHLFPGLAVSRRLAAMRPKLRIVFAGTGREREKRLVAEAGFAYETVPCHPAPRRLREVVPFLTTSAAGYRAARGFLDRHAVRVVVGLGGYASVPMARAALKSRIPLVLLEQNALPGRANRWLAPRADVLCAAFAEAKHHLPPPCRVRLTGNPLREEFSALFEDRAPPLIAERTCHGPHRQSVSRRPWPPLPADPGVPGGPVVPPPVQRPRQLLVLGGSRGARWLNRNVPPALAEIKAHLPGWKVLHQTGEADPEATQAAYRRFGIEAVVRPFIQNVAATLASTDAAVCRAGGTTLAELAAAGVPALLVPYPYAADDHQRRNAEVYAEAGGCFLLDERDLTDGPELPLARHILPLIGNRSVRETMAAEIRRLAYPDAARDIAAMLASMLPGRTSGSVSAGLERQSAA